MLLQLEVALRFEVLEDLFEVLLLQLLWQDRTGAVLESFAPEVVGDASTQAVGIDEGSAHINMV